MADMSLMDLQLRCKGKRRIKKKQAAKKCKFYSLGAACVCVHVSQSAREAQWCYPSWRAADNEADSPVGTAPYWASAYAQY